jgi:hypothetical protein
MEIDATKVGGVDDCSTDLRVEGRFHVAVRSATEDKEVGNYRADVIEYEVLAGEVPGQEGKTIDHMMFRDDDGNPREEVLRFVLAAGLAKAGEKSEVFLDRDAPGKQLVVAVTHWKKKDRYVVGNMGMDTWPIDHPDVESVPKDQSALSMLNEGDPVASAKSAGEFVGAEGPEANAETSDDLADI